MRLMKHQERALELMKDGCILYGGVGSGKSLTGASYYKKNHFPKKVYVITTARKRDALDWPRDFAAVGVTADYFTIDSWNNVGKYVDVVDALFIFDEQRSVGRGAWSKALIRISKRNQWIMLTATPGDTWMDYATVFVANGFYKNVSEFKRQHVVYEPWSKYPKISGYRNSRRLEALRSTLLVEMPYLHHTKRILNWLSCQHDDANLTKICKQRWNIFEDKPAKDIAEVFRLMRKLVNSDPSRLATIEELTKIHKRLIVFYNYNYELDILLELKDHHNVFQWNGNCKDSIPESEEWVYLVQYTAGAEAWNCVTTNAMVLYSLTYSYRIFEQVQGRIDRLNTPYTDLYYYILMSNSVVDQAIRRSLERKEAFNEAAFMEHPFEIEDDTDEKYALFD